MKLLFLHGAPAAGKLTVAKALVRLMPGRLIKDLETNKYSPVRRPDCLKLDTETRPAEATARDS